MAESRNHLMYLEDIQTSMNRIQEYIFGLTFEQFKDDYKTIDAVVRNFEIIGEATKNLPKEVKERYPDTPWSSMYRLRNRLTHEYFGIDYEVIWRIASEYLPQNLSEINSIISEEKNRSS